MSEPNIKVIADLAESHKELVYPLPLLSTNKEEFMKKMKELPPMHPHSFVGLSFQPAPFPELRGADAFKEIPRELLEKYVVKVLLNPTGDDRVFGFGEVLEWSKGVRKEKKIFEQQLALLKSTLNDHAGPSDKDQIEAAAKHVAEVIVTRAMASADVADRLHEYLQFNFNPGSEAVEFMRTHWFSQNGDIATKLAIHHGVAIASRAILAMAGGKNNGTPPHIDISQAETRAYALCEQPLPEGTEPLVLAIWYYFAAQVLDIVDDYLKREYGVGLDCGKDKMPFFSEEDFAKLQELCGYDAETKQPLAVRREQKHGECESFDTGVLHQVLNVSDGVLKIAFDVYRLENLKKYFYVRALPHCQLMVSDGSAPPMDYAGLEDLIFKELTNPMPV